MLEAIFVFFSVFTVYMPAPAWIWTSLCNVIFRRLAVVVAASLIPVAAVYILPLCIRTGEIAPDVPWPVLWAAILPVAGVTAAFRLQRRYWPARPVWTVPVALGTLQAVSYGVLFLVLNATSPATPSLVAAVGAHDVEGAREHIQAGADLHGRFKEDLPLVFFALGGDPETLPGIIAFLVAAGAPINAAAPDGMTSLALSAMRCDALGAKALLDHGADPELPDLKGRTPLFYLGECSPETARRVADLLLVHGANPARRDVWGFTPAELARMRGAPELADSLAAPSATAVPPATAGHGPANSSGVP